MASKTRIPLLFGTMIMGFQGQNGVRNHDKQECQEIMDTYFEYGKELDTARNYGEGTTEELLAQLDLKDATIDTKVYPVKPGGHSPAALRETFMTSLKALGRNKVRTLYLHAPDRSVPFEATCEEMDKLYHEGRFEIFGLSNFASWEVAEIVGICKAKNWIQPTIYQCMYNAITRAMEPELLPCLRKFGIRCVIYNATAGGFFAGKLTSVEDPGPEGRFNPDSRLGRMYRERYVKIGYFKALEHLKQVASEHDLRLTEIALRWCQHHSLLTPEDGVILGASNARHMVMRENCEDSTKGPLPKAVVDALDEAYQIVLQHGSQPSYWR